MSHGQWWAEVGQWEEFFEGSAATHDSGKTNAVKDSAQKADDEQKQPDRDKQQPVHPLV